MRVSKPTRWPTMSARLLPLIAALLLATFAASADAASGAIYSTIPEGDAVNQNADYPSKNHVYLKVGNAVDDGTYVFQVTDPSGSTLLSVDPAKCRLVEVTAGVITRLANPTEVGLPDGYDLQDGRSVRQCHVADASTGAGPSGRHDSNPVFYNNADAIVVQLMPFWNTPSEGGSYKVWMSKLDAYLASGGNLEEVPSGVVSGSPADPGFSSDNSKTDNFNFKIANPLGNRV